MMDITRREFLKESLATLGVSGASRRAFRGTGGLEADNWRQTVQLAWHEGKIDLDHF